MQLPKYADSSKQNDFAFSALPEKPGGIQPAKVEPPKVQQNVVSVKKVITVTDWQMMGPATSIKDLLRNMMVAAECSTSVAEVGQHILETKEVIGKINMFHPILFEMLMYGGQLKPKKTVENNEPVLRDLLSKTEKWIQS